MINDFKKMIKRSVLNSEESQSFPYYGVLYILTLQWLLRTALAGQNIIFCYFSLMQFDAKGGER